MWLIWIGSKLKKQKNRAGNLIGVTKHSRKKSEKGSLKKR